MENKTENKKTLEGEEENWSRFCLSRSKQKTNDPGGCRQRNWGWKFANVLQEQVDEGGVVWWGARRRTGSEQTNPPQPDYTETREAQPPTHFLPLLLLHPSVTRIPLSAAASLFSDVLGGCVSLPGVRATRDFFNDGVTEVNKAWAAL